MSRLTKPLVLLAGSSFLVACGGADPANALIGSKKTAEHTQVKMQMKGLADAMYAQHLSSEWPTSLEEFVADGSAKPSDIKDPWGNYFIYAPPSTSSDENPVFFSFGPDGDPETADDVHHEWN